MNVATVNYSGIAANSKRHSKDTQSKQTNGFVIETLKNMKGYVRLNTDRVEGEQRHN